MRISIITGQYHGLSSLFDLATVLMSVAQLHANNICNGDHICHHQIGFFQLSRWQHSLPDDDLTWIFGDRIDMIAVDGSKSS